MYLLLMVDLNPLVTIGLPIRNEGKYIAQTLDDLLAQDYPNAEIIVSDNASSDETEKVCREYAAKHSRIIYQRLDADVDASENFNRLVRQARGEFFVWSAGHDRHAPNFISRLLPRLLEDPSVVLCYSLVRPIDESGNFVNRILSPVETQGMPGPILRLLLTSLELGNDRGSYIYGLMRTSAMKKTGLFPDHIIGPDLVMFTELALLGTFACVREPLFFPRWKWTGEFEHEAVMERYKRTMFFKNKFSAFPAWRYFKKQLQAISGSPVSLRHKIIGIPAFSLLFFYLNRLILLADLQRNLKRRIHA